MTLSNTRLLAVAAVAALLSVSGPAAAQTSESSKAAAGKAAAAKKDAKATPSGKRLDFAPTSPVVVMPVAPKVVPATTAPAAGGGKSESGDCHHSGSNA